MKRFIYISFLGAGLTACSSFSYQVDYTESVPVFFEEPEKTSTSNLIEPYRDSMQVTMQVVLGKADTTFNVERPCGNLNNWVADAIFHQAMNIKSYPNAFCLLNTGGIRASINQGNVVLGDIYRIAPFDNELVWVKLPVNVLEDIANYLKVSGGEPIANAHLISGQLKINEWNDSLDYCWVATSDYLFQGGDHMEFFQNKLDENRTGALLRDLLIEEVKGQGTLVSNSKNRMQ